MKTWTDGLPGACRAFRAMLSEPHATDHAATCAACREHRDRVAAIGDLLRSLPRPAVPESLGSEASLEAIFERAHLAAAADVAPVLREALAPTRAPADADWAGDLAARTGSALRSLSAPRTPDWIWLRIRSDFRSHLETRRPRRLLRAAGLLAAAGLVGIAVLLFGSGERNGTAVEPVIVFRTVDAPPDQAVSALPTLRRIGRADW